MRSVGALVTRCRPDGSGEGLLTRRRTRASVHVGPRRARLSVHAAAVDVDEDDGWWRHGLEELGVVVIDSTPAFLDTLATAGDKLVVVHFYARWCGACKALHPKASSLLRERADTVVHALVEYDSQKALAKRLGVKVLPFFQLYRGANGKLKEFSCTLTKVQMLRDALTELDGPRP